MQTDFLRLFKKPLLYERTESVFWDDDHISAQLLQAHLDPSFEGASRPHAFIERSAEWIGRTVPPEIYPALLDLGCGPGLYCKGKIRTRLFRRGKTCFAGIRQSRTPRLFRLPLLFAKIFSKKIFWRGCGMI